MHSATIIHAKETRPVGVAGKVSPLTVGLSVAGAILLATKIYFVSELLVLLAALALLFSLGTSVVILFVVVHECGKWSIRRFNEAKHAAVLSPRGPATVRMPELALPTQIEASRKV